MAAGIATQDDQSATFSSFLNEILTGSVQSVTNGMRSVSEAVSSADKQPDGGLQAAERRPRQSVYGLVSDAPPWVDLRGVTASAVASQRVNHRSPTWGAKISDWFRGAGDIVRGIQSPTADAVVDGRRLHSKVAIVTGGNSGLGLEVSRALCKAGARVILACRDMRKARDACSIIEASLTKESQAVKVTHDTEWIGADYAPIGTVEPMLLDLSDLDSVRQFAAKFLELECRLHYLVCNAGKMATPFRRTVQGFEWQFGINYLGHFLLTQLLLDKLEATAQRGGDGTRLIMLTSQAHRLGQIHWEDQFLNERHLYDPWKSHFQSKLAMCLMTVELDRQLAARCSAANGDDDAPRPRLTVHAVHPGLINTNITRELSTVAKSSYTAGQPLFRSVAQGAATVMHCLLKVQHTTVRGGAYFEDCAEAAFGSEVTGDAATELWALSQWMAQQNSTYLQATRGLALTHAAVLTDYEQQYQQKQEQPEEEQAPASYDYGSKMLQTWDIIDAPAAAGKPGEVADWELATYAPDVEEKQQQQQQQQQQQRHRQKYVSSSTSTTSILESVCSKCTFYCFVSV